MNAIWIFGDQHRAQALSINGDPNCVTPNLDRLAVEEQNYTGAVSGCPLCCPYRGSLLTSRYPQDVILRPNVPKIPRVEERARRELAGYYAMIENLDWNVGRVRDVLIDAGLDKDTHIIFFSDHGDMHGSQGHFLKTSPYEESLRVPLIMAA